MRMHGLQGYNLLTAKPVIYAANVAEDDLADDGEQSSMYRQYENTQQAEQRGICYLCTDRAGDSELDEDEERCSLRIWD